MQDIRNIKILIVGESNVGKTCIIERYIGREFDRYTEPTLGVSCFEKQVKLEENNKLTLNLWDTAGQERFQSLVRLYSKGALGCFIAYDITNRESFEKLENWFNIVLQNIKVPIILVGNKTDIVEEDEEKRKVSIEEGMDFAKKKMYLFLKPLLKTKKILIKYLKRWLTKL
jgi:small GTP-binding protein